MCPDKILAYVGKNGCTSIGMLIAALFIIPKNTENEHVFRLGNVDEIVLHPYQEMSGNGLKV